MKTERPSADVARFVGALALDADVGALRARLGALREARARAVVVAGDFVLGVALARELAAFPGAVIAALAGEARDGGFETALACDIRIAGESARLAAGDAVDARRLARLAGEAVARDLLITGRTVGAREALALGLVSTVVEDAAVADEARAWATLVAERAPLSVQANKECLVHCERLPLREAVAYERQGWARLQRTKDHKEALAAFFAKRAPEFTGE